MKRILIADDDPHLRLLVRTTLEGPACEVLEASNGQAARELASKEMPDLLILDWMMPNETGVDVLRALREDPETSGLPVIMLTGQSEKAYRNAAILLGIRGYLVKPFSPVELIELVDKVLEGERVSS
jgi:DNA-binding response OmpR family regulator